MIGIPASCLPALQLSYNINKGSSHRHKKFKLINFCQKAAKNIWGSLRNLINLFLCKGKFKLNLTGMRVFLRLSGFIHFCSKSKSKRMLNLLLLASLRGQDLKIFQVSASLQLPLVFFANLPCSIHCVTALALSFFVFLIFSWLYVFIMSRTRFRLNPHSIVTWMSRNSLLKTGTIS